MRGRTPAGREYATHAAGAGGRLPEGVSMAAETFRTGPECRAEDVSESGQTAMVPGISASTETIPVERIFRGRCNPKHEATRIALFGLPCWIKNRKYTGRTRPVPLLHRNDMVAAFPKIGS